MTHGDLRVWDASLATGGGTLLPSLAKLASEPLLIGRL